MPSDEKFSRMTATTRLRKTNEPISWKPMKYGTAAAEPHVPAASEQRPEAAVTAASDMSPDQLSPVRHWKRGSSSAARRG